MAVRSGLMKHMTSHDEIETNTVKIADTKILVVLCRIFLIFPLIMPIEFHRIALATMVTSSSCKFLPVMGAL